MSRVFNKSILVVGKFYTEGFATHIAQTLEQMGHRVARYEPGVKVTQSTSQWARLQWGLRDAVQLAVRQSNLLPRWSMKRLLSAGQGKTDLVIVCHDFLLPREVAMLKKVTHSPVVLWFPDHIANFQRAYFLNSAYDALFFKDPYIVRTLKRVLETPMYYLPECCNPALHNQQMLSEQDRRDYGCDLATAGNMYSYRAAFFSQLQGYDVKIWGNPPPLWMDTSVIRSMIQNKFVANEIKSKAFRAAKIVVNNIHPAEIWGINVRAFEICAAGAFQLIDWRPGLSQVFEDGSELVSFKNGKDLKDKIDHYLRHDSERARISRRGMERVMREHTYEIRLQLLLNTVFKSQKGYPMPTCDESRNSS